MGEKTQIDEKQSKKVQQIRLINKLYAEADQHFETPVANSNSTPSQHDWTKTRLAQE